MNELQQRLYDTLIHVAKRLHNTGFLSNVAARLDTLAEQIPQPCVVAVVGRVKAGKSTFINALLGEDLAKVGPTETTATINYFRGGTPNPLLPVRCHWRGGRVTNEDRQFLDNLQGNDIETLRRADGIDHLEYLVQNHYLEEITLVDTPGTGSAIDEHQNRTAEYMNLSRQLRERHHQDTQRIGSEADAVIYLIGETARTNDQSFLEEFQQATQGQSRSLNAIGVMAKIDLNEDVINRREELSKKIALQLQNSLNTVIPVSAGIHRALGSLLAQEQASLKHMIAVLRPVASDTLDELLADPELYLETECSVPVAERKQLREDMPWRVFSAIARIIVEPSLDIPEIVGKLQAIAGFERLHEVLDQHFVRRGKLLRSYRIVNDALKVVEDVKYSYLREFRRRQAENDNKRKRFLYFLQHTYGASPVAQELAAFVDQQLAPRVDLGKVVDEVERELSMMKYELEDYNLDFVALQQVEDNSTLFASEELNELRPLFGLYGLEMEKRLPPANMTLSYVGERQEYWDWKSHAGRTHVLREVAEHATRRYGMFVDTLVQVS